MSCAWVGVGGRLHGYLAHKKKRPTRTLNEDYAWGPMVALGEDAVSYGRGTPVWRGDPPLIGRMLALSRGKKRCSPLIPQNELIDWL